ncbi:DUF3466 family protein [Aestuariibacter salexigens]|uniref:DUF3466 family protein n=1 Tax=Aestuariibacter salexigens TaxID=226010 RepID=UPI00041EAF65|nr:DUF3466 family protein [Aestuariibacter salexigens]
MNNFSKSVLFSAVATAFSANNALADSHYSFELVTYPGAENTSIFGLNDRGFAVGPSDGGNFSYSLKSGGISDLEIGDLEDAAVLATSDSGHYAGVWDDAENEWRLSFYMDKKGKVTTFEHPDALDVTNARAMNNNGLITGYFSVEKSTPFAYVAADGFIYDVKKGTFETIVPSMFTIAQGINNDGIVVGSARFWPEEDPCIDAFPQYTMMGWVRNKGGDVTYFTINGMPTRARGISDSDTVVGFAFDPSDNTNKGFVIDIPEGQCVTVEVDSADMMAAPDALATYPQAIKNSGEIVGSAVVIDGQGELAQVGFVARKQ